MGPDEIWIGAAAKADRINLDIEELLIDRRYIRADPDTGIVIVMEIG